MNISRDCDVDCDDVQQAEQRVQSTAVCHPNTHFESSPSSSSSNCPFRSRSRVYICRILPAIVHGSPTNSTRRQPGIRRRTQTELWASLDSTRLQPFTIGRPGKLDHSFLFPLVGPRIGEDVFVTRPAMIIYLDLVENLLKLAPVDPRHF